MTALRTPDGNYVVFVLSVDDLEWTRHWLGRLRCDQLLVYVATSEDVTPRLKIRAVESKSSSEVEEIEPAPHVEPFAKASEQVVSTLDALWRLLETESESQLVEDLRFAAFIEHLASVALSDMYPLEPSDAEALFVLRCISDFSLSRATEQLKLDGVAVCTQYRAAVTPKVVQYELPGEDSKWPVLLVRAGAGDLDSLLGAEVSRYLVERAPEPTPEQPSTPTSEPEAPGPVGEEESEAKKERVDTVDGEDESGAIAEDLFLACTHRGFRVSRPVREMIVVGPSLVSIPMEMEAGSSIRQIEQATEDLAREVGVQSVSVENDPDHPFHVRFLVARKQRNFPTLPDAAPSLVEEESQSYLAFFLGETLDGTDFQSWLSSWPHMLVAGTTGSGKTTFLRALLQQVDRLPPGAVEVAVVDGKGEVDYFNLIDPGRFTSRFPDVLLGHTHAVEVLEWVVQEEMPRRRSLIVDRAKSASEGRPKTAREFFVDSLQDHAKTVDPFPALLVVVDEFAEIMLARRGGEAKRFEQLVQQVTQVGRSVLVHLVLATQRPDSVVVAGGIKANLDARVALRLPTHHDSMTILGGKGAETLLGRGDLIFRSAGQVAVRLQGYST